MKRQWVNDGDQTQEPEKKARLFDVDGHTIKSVIIGKLNDWCVGDWQRCYILNDLPHIDEFFCVDVNFSQIVLLNSIKSDFVFCQPCFQVHGSKLVEKLRMNNDIYQAQEIYEQHFFNRLSLVNYMVKFTTFKCLMCQKKLMYIR